MSSEPDNPAPTQILPPESLRGNERFLPGTVLGRRYRIVALLGRGGMGEVYRADDLKIGQPVALKFLPADLERDPSRLQRLLGEVRIARQVSHPNVCRVHDVVELDGHHFITMEYVDGEDLAALLRRIGRLPQEKALDLARQIGAGLAAAHVQGIVHRDLKPANIMLDGQGRARITDFGLATAAEAARGKEALSGTPAYMAPEQRAGGEITPRTDVYALGLVLFEMFTGRKALRSSTQPASDSRAGEMTGSPSSFVPGLDPAIDSGILRCLETDPAKRPDSAVGLLAVLPGGDPLEAALRAGETPSPEMVAAAGEEGSPSSAKAWGWFGLALLAAVAAILLFAGATGLDQVPMPHSPDILRERARDIVHRFGGDGTPRSVEWWFDLDDGYTEWSLGKNPPPSLAGVRPSPLQFHYRDSPAPMVSNESMRPTRRDPAPFWSGESYVALDPQGNLLEFSRIGRQVAPTDTGHVAPVDWNPVLALTGVDIHDLRAVQPLWTPDVPCDARSAWVANRRGGTARIEAAAWRGKPVWLRTIAPWERAERESQGTPYGYAGLAFFVAMVAIIVLAFAVLARHNLRLGRSDTRGALRAALTVFISFTLADALVFRWTIEPIHLFRWMLRLHYLPALAAWLVYLGIEPFLRRRWPRRLIASTRLLTGRLADPLVGREVLLGFLAGTAIVLARCLPAVLERRSDASFLVGVVPLGRGADYWAMIADILGEGVMRGLSSFGTLLLLRVLFRRDAAAWLGLGIMWVLISVPSWNMSALEWLGIVAATACFVLAVRVGLVAAMVAVIVSDIIAVTPLTLDFSRWYAWRTGAAALLLFAIAVWGFRAAMGRRRILSAAMLDG